MNTTNTQLELFTSVPFVDEVEEFNQLMNKPNNYEPTMNPQSPKKKNGSLYTTLYWRNLRNIEKRVNRETSLAFWTLCVTLLMFPWGTELCYMVLRIKFGQPIKKFKDRTYQKLAQAKRRLNKQSNKGPRSRANHAIMKGLVVGILFTAHQTKRS